MPDLAAASEFMTGYARMLDRRRFELLFGGGDSTGASVLAALDAYRNADGGYGWGLEPDLRSPESQPGGALHALEALEDLVPVTSPRAAALCDWLMAHSLPDGGLPFALPVGDPAGCAPFWVAADSTASSLQITAIVAATAHRVAAHDRAVADHPWLEAATGYCLRAIRVLGEEPHALVLAFAVRFLDAVHDLRSEAPALLERLGRHVPASGLVHVAGGTAEEMMRPLDFAPTPGRPARGLFAPEVVAAELERLEGQQADDGGWPVDFASYSPAAALEWRGHATVRALQILAAAGR